MFSLLLNLGRVVCSSGDDYYFCLSRSARLRHRSGHTRLLYVVPGVDETNVELIQIICAGWGWAQYYMSSPDCDICHDPVGFCKIGFWGHLEDWETAVSLPPPISTLVAGKEDAAGHSDRSGARSFCA